MLIDGVCVCVYCFCREMPALKLFGRKWLAATDDLVYPGLFELFIRLVW